jgi:hypothetical protein
MKNLSAVLFVGAIALFGLGGCATHKQVSNQQLALAIPLNPVEHCHGKDGLPDSNCTPGVVRTTDVTNICHGGSTKQYRPPTSYTNKLKLAQIKEYGYSDTNPRNYEEDHLISLELGGDGKDPKNLWPEPHLGNNNSFEKDKVENWLHRQICSGAISPGDAQTGISTNWRQYLPAVSGQKISHKEVQ